MRYARSQLADGLEFLRLAQLDLHERPLLVGAFLACYVSLDA
jgi:hypothetical protein